MNRAKTDPMRTLAVALVLAAAAASASPPKIDAFTVDTAASQSTIRFTAEAEATYELQRASVLAPTSDWATVDTRRADAAGSMELTDAVPAGWTRGYYRIAEAAAPAPYKGVQLWEGGPYWAECNVGASKPEEYGYYFWWGDTVGYTPSGGTWTDDYYYDGVTWVSSTGQQMGYSPFSLSVCPTCGKDNSALLSEGWIDATGNLTAAHDAATAYLGAPWRMPTYLENADLIYKCDWTLTTKNGVNGYEIRGRGDYASSSIFLPAAGTSYLSELRYPGSDSFFWASTQDEFDSDSAWELHFYSDSGPGFSRNGARCTGRTVRPVRRFAQ